MLYELEPAKELTGGPWYGPDAFDSEFIGMLRDVSRSLCVLVALSGCFALHFLIRTAWYAGYDDLHQ